MPPQPAPLILFVDNDAPIGELGAIILNPAIFNAFCELGKQIFLGLRRQDEPLRRTLFFRLSAPLRCRPTPEARAAYEQALVRPSRLYLTCMYPQGKTRTVSI
jgi:hypothetical protein